MKPFWSVAYGSNESHIHDAKIFKRLKDAMEFRTTLKKPYLIYRHTRDHPFSNNGTDEVVYDGRKLFN